MTAHPDAEAVFDPLAPGYFDDPYPHYAAIREATPVYFEPRTDTYLITRYADCHRLLRDRSMLVEIDRATPNGRIQAELARNAALDAGPDKWMVFRDGDDHTRLRRLVSQVFTPKAIEAWRQRTEAVVANLLDAAEESDPFDLISQFARPLPAQIISEMLGIPDADIPQVLHWSQDLLRCVEPLNTAEQEQRIIDSTRAIIEYLRDLLEHKRSEPGGDVLTALLAAGDSGDHLSVDEIIAQVALLYAAGHETTVAFLGNSVTHLFARPADLEQLRRDPSVVPAAVDELLRFEPPLHITRRIPIQTFDVHGTTIPAGADVLIAIASANHDPAKFGDNADSIDFTRKNAADHLAFSSGTHYCLGASLARLESSIALPTLLQRFPRLAPAEDKPAWAPRLVIRGVDRLLVHPDG